MTTLHYFNLLPHPGVQLHPSAVQQLPSSQHACPAQAHSLPSVINKITKENISKFGLRRRYRGVAVAIWSFVVPHESPWVLEFVANIVTILLTFKHDAID